MWDPDLAYWVLARIAGLTCYAALAVSLLSGIAVRSRFWAQVGGGHRALISLHQYTTVLWLPLGLVHVEGLLLDHVSRIGLADVVVPFRVSYGSLGIGLGTVAFDLILILAVTGWARQSIRPRIWLWIHRLSYAAFASIFVHSALSGTDFDRWPVAMATWGTAAAVGAQSAAKLLSAGVRGATAFEERSVAN